MPKLARWYSELGPQGLVMIGMHAQKGTEAEIRSVVSSKGAHYTIVDRGSVQGGNDFSGIPHCLLFDYTGKCIYRGHPEGAEALLLKAVQEAPPSILAGKKLSKLSALNSSLRREASLGTALHQAKEKESSKDPATAEEAKYVVEKITAHANKLLDSAKDKKDSEPGTAWNLLNRVANNFKGTDQGKEAADLVAELKKDKAFQTEVKAWPMLENIKALEAQLTAPEGTADTKSAAFKSANAAALSRMLDLVKQMKKAAPNAKATQEAMQIAENYGVKVN